MGKMRRWGGGGEEEGSERAHPLPHHPEPDDQRVDEVACDPNPTTKITPHVFDIQENGVHLKLTIIDTPGFGEAINTSEWFVVCGALSARSCSIMSNTSSPSFPKSWRPVVKYVDDAFQQYLSDESRVNRKKIEDRRVHCCLYFINPAGRGLKPLDIEAMKALHNKVNIVPLIAKADTLTKTELDAFKSRVMNQIEEHDIAIFKPILEDEDIDDDEEDMPINTELFVCAVELRMGKLYIPPHLANNFPFSSFPKGCYAVRGDWQQHPGEGGRAHCARTQVPLGCRRSRQPRAL